MNPKAQWTLFRESEVAGTAGTPGVTRKFFTGLDVGSLDLSTGITRFEPGAGLFWHYHTVGESITILEGEPVCEIGGADRPAASTPMRPFDTVFIPANTPHRFINPTDRPVRILWSYPTGRVERHPINPDSTPAAKEA